MENEEILGKYFGDTARKMTKSAFKLSWKVNTLLGFANWSHMKNCNQTFQGQQWILLISFLAKHQSEQGIFNGRSISML